MKPTGVDGFPEESRRCAPAGALYNEAVTPPRPTFPSPAAFSRAVPFFALACLTAGAPRAASAAPEPPPVTRAFVEKHCFECHDDTVKKGGLDLSSLPWDLGQPPGLGAWVKIHDRIERGEMPPADKARPEAEEQAALLADLGKHLHDASAKAQEGRGRTVLRRLNRMEYENTVHALLGIEAPLRGLLPEDTPAHGFDTVAEGLRLSTLQMETYLEAADAALDAAIQLTTEPEKVSGRFSYKEEDGVRENIDTPAGTVKDKDSGNKHVVTLRELPDAIVFFSDADFRGRLKKLHPRAPGRYRIRVSAYGFQTQGEPIVMRVYADSYREKRLLGWYEIPADKPREIEIEARLERNEGISVGALNIGYDEQGRGVYGISAPDYTGRGIAIQWVECEGPRLESWPPPSTKNLFPGVRLKEYEKNRQPWRDGKRWAYEFDPEDPEGDLTRIVTAFAGRAFRRPLQPEETDRFVRLAQDVLGAGGGFEQAARVGFRAILTSPQFLLFEEAPGALDGHALASRLSYFLWSGPPDEALLQLAANGELTKPAVLRAQTERLLKDARSARFVKHFTGQWLEMRNIDATTPDPKLYPEYDEILKLSMVAETEAYFREMLDRDLDAAYLVKSDFAMVNRRLADHYGIPDVAGETLRRVSLPADSVRGGFLTQASVLKVTANGTVSSPVVRGTWVMKHLLGQPPLPPPPNVGSVEPDTRGATTIREQLDKHRNSETCAGCHRSIDPPGFALESFDVIGGWRDRYRSQEKGDRPPGKLRGRGIGEYKLGLPVDASGQLADGRGFQDIREFRQLLLDNRERLDRALAENLVIYGTGAGISFADREAVAEIVSKAGKDGGGLRTTLREIVLSDLFRHK